jgi:transcriptional regulator with XRE-family HTH domain
MKSFNELIKTEEYWMEDVQNEIFRQVYFYMNKESLNQTQLAKRLNVSKGYISQILNGNFNFSLKKLIELSLKLNVAPIINYESIDQYLKRKEDENIISLETYYSRGEKVNTELTEKANDTITSEIDPITKSIHFEGAA